jgi:hypothetical protein
VKIIFMGIYIAFYVICFTMLSISMAGGRLLRGIGIFLCLTAMFLFSGFNPGKGTDYVNYRDIFYGTEYLVDSRDIGFYAFTILFRTAGFEFQSFLLAIALLYFLAIYVLVKKMAHPIFFVFLYLCGFYLYFQFNAMKQGIAIMLMLVGISWGRSLRGMGFLTVSALFHTSQAAVVLLHLAQRKKFLMGLAVFPVIWLTATFYSPYYLQALIETEKVIHPVLITKGIFCVWALRFGGAKFWAVLVVCSVVAVEFGAVFVSRIVDALVMIVIFQLCSVSRSFTKWEKFIISIVGLFMFIGSLNIVYQDCVMGSSVWCNYGEGIFEGF